MNTMIMRRHLLESRHDIVPCDLIVLFHKKKRFTPQFGLINVKREHVIIVDGKEKRME